MTAFLQKVYDRCPIPFQNLMTTVKGMQNARTRYGRAYYRELAFLEEFDGWPLERKKEYQDSELVRFIHYASEHSPFYSRLYAGIDLDAIRTADDLKRLPIVDKEMLRTNIDEVMTIGKRGSVEGHTGGTTGKSLVVRFTIEDHMRGMAMLDHFKAQYGFINNRMPKATFNGQHIIPPGQRKKIFWRYNAAAMQMIFSSFYLTEENLPYYIDALNRFQPREIDGFPTALAEVAFYMERKGLAFSFVPAAAFTTSENLSEDMRRLIEKAFGCKVYDQYASGEGAPFIGECPCQHKHMALSSGVFESYGEENEILVTSFTTHGTPLIRYRIGDCMDFAGPGEICPCGSHVPYVKTIMGRNTDFLYNEKMEKIFSWKIADLLKHLPGCVMEAQYVQDDPGEVKAYYRVDPQAFTQEHEKRIRETFRYTFGDKTKMTIFYVDTLCRASSGKRKLIINHVGEG